LNTQRKLELLADASRFDLACACGTNDRDHRTRGQDGAWLYPVSLPSGGTSVLLKTLLSNVCVNDCLYCPFRSEQDTRRCTLAAEEVAQVFMDYFRRRKVFGLFLSSAVVRDADYAMEKVIAVARILRAKYQYRGYMHLKVMPGASDAAIEEMMSLASAVSLNVEVPRRANLLTLSHEKDYHEDIVRPIKRISQLRAPGSPYARVKQTTQFIIGAADGTDADIVNATFGLYKRLRLSRVYYSAYQRGVDDPELPGQQRRPARPGDLLTREHRLYQADWLLRKYGFDAGEIPFEADGALSLETDPKEAWARLHPEFFPLDVNRADRLELLRVPGFGPTTVKRILDLRKNGAKMRSLSPLGKMGKRLRKAQTYLKFGY